MSAAKLPPGVLRLAAPAKLNLSLAVIGRRADGLHELASVVVLLELADELVAPQRGGLVVTGPEAGGVPTSADANLAWRGLLAGMAPATTAPGLGLHKRIPPAAGLGGGSSDAAAGWRLGRRLADRSDRASAGDLAELAAIGADVPVFAAQQAAAWVTGIGEEIGPLPVPDLHVVLVHPPFGLATRDVFAELRRDEWSSPPPPPSRPHVGSNDLLAPALRLRPELEALMRLVAEAGGEPHLTGSGPTVFAASNDAERVDAVASRLRRGGRRVTRTRTRRAPASIDEA